jgi:hypothetical protein
MVIPIIKSKKIEPSIRFINVQNGEMSTDIWNHLAEGMWRDLSSENYEHNVMQGLLNRPNCKPVLNGFLPIYPEMIWNSEKKELEDPYFIPVKRETSLKDFLIAAELFFTKYSNKKIGVQLSGGLDSSIIIALLKHFGIPFSLIGMSSSQYEFRSEKHIQNILAEWSSEVSLLDYEKHLPLFDIDKIPAFQYPDMLCLNYSADNAMALECERLGVDILLTGNGGDNVFADNVPENPELSTWLPQIFTDTWLIDIVYAPKGVQLVPFFGDKQIMQTLYNLRLGKPEDNAKLWARNFFRDFIPQELVNYTYCADFWGLYIDGLQKSIPTVRKLFNRAYDLTNHSCFSKKSINELFDQDLLNAHKSMYQKIEARISLAVWLNALFK